MAFLLRAIDNGNNDADSVVRVEPQPGFVVKSKLVSSYDGRYSLGAKVFVNVCHEDQVPQPEIPFNPSVVYPLIMTNQWEIPIIASALRQDRDKKGDLCYVCDCCINSACMQWARTELQLREILVEWCLESCELRQRIEISREHLAFPKLRMKGASIPPLEVLTTDLHADFRHEMRDLAKREAEPASILELKRELIDADLDSTSIDSSALPPLFPSKTPTRPLIQEIDSTSTSSQAPAKTVSTTPPTTDPAFDISMGKPSAQNSQAKLKIDIVSLLPAESDYLISYNSNENTLTISHTNTTHFLPKEITIALPHVVASSTPQITTAFDDQSRKMTIYL